MQPMCVSTGQLTYTTHYRGSYYMIFDYKYPVEFHVAIIFKQSMEIPIL